MKDARRLRATGGTLRPRAAAIAVAGALTAAENGFAHGGPLDRPVTYADWNFDPVILLVLAIFGWLYVQGTLRMWHRAGIGRVVRGRSAICFGIGLAALLVALLSPLDPLSDQLSAAHMVQHMVLMTVAAPLMMAGAPWLVLLWGLSPTWRRTLARCWNRCSLWRSAAVSLWQPIVAGAIYALATWIWHVPALYEAALVNPYIHDIQHISFFVAACLFWRVLLDPVSRLRLHAPAAVALLFATALHATILGMLMALSPDPWYMAYEGRTSLWGLTPLEDQQLAGLIMWMPACLAYLVVAVILLVGLLSEFQRPVQRSRFNELQVT